MATEILKTFKCFKCFLRYQKYVDSRQFGPTQPSDSCNFFILRFTCFRKNIHFSFREDSENWLTSKFSSTYITFSRILLNLIYCWVKNSLLKLSRNWVKNLKQTQLVSPQKIKGQLKSISSATAVKNTYLRLFIFLWELHKLVLKLKLGDQILIIAA